MEYGVIQLTVEQINEFLQNAGNIPAIEATQGEHGERITALETASTEQASAIDSLQQASAEQADKITEVESTQGAEKVTSLTSTSSASSVGLTLTKSSGEELTAEIAAASEEAAGVMSAEDKRKLNSAITYVDSYLRPTSGTRAQMAFIAADGTAHFVYANAADTANAGLMSAADKRKLNALPDVSVLDKITIIDLGTSFGTTAEAWAAAASEGLKHDACIMTYKTSGNMSNVIVQNRYSANDVTQMLFAEGRMGKSYQRHVSSSEVGAWQRIMMPLSMGATIGESTIMLRGSSLGDSYDMVELPAATATGAGLMTASVFKTLVSVAANIEAIARTLDSLIERVAALEAGGGTGGDTSALEARIAALEETVAQLTSGEPTVWLNQENNNTASTTVIADEGTEWSVS